MYTPEEIDQAIAVKTDDLNDFVRAYRLMYDRIKRSEESDEKVLPIHEWSGAVGLVQVMEPILHSMEKVLEELKKEREKMSPRKPNLVLVTSQESEDDERKA